MQDKQISGYFLSFTEPELKKIHAMLKEEGLSQDLDGLKHFILDCAQPQERPGRESAADRVLRNIEGLILDNPHTVSYLMDTIGRAIRGGKKKTPAGAGV